MRTGSGPLVHLKTLSSQWIASEMRLAPASTRGTSLLTTPIAFRPWRTSCGLQYRITPRFYVYPKEGVFQQNSPRPSPDKRRFRQPGQASGDYFLPQKPPRDFYHKNDTRGHPSQLRYVRYVFTAILSWYCFSAGSKLYDKVPLVDQNSTEAQKRLDELTSEFNDMTFVQRLRSGNVFDESVFGSGSTWREWPAYQALNFPPARDAAAARRKRDTLTTGPYATANGLAVQEIFYNQDAQTLYLFVNFGHAMCSKPGVVHPGAIATVIDEGLGRVALRSTEERAAVTAKLEVRPRRPLYAGQWYILYARLALDDDLPGCNDQKAAPKGWPPVHIQESKQRHDGDSNLSDTHDRLVQRSRKRYVHGWLGKPFVDTIDWEDEADPRAYFGLDVCAHARGLFVVPKNMELPSIGVHVRAVEDDY